MNNIIDLRDKLIEKEAVDVIDVIIVLDEINGKVDKLSTRLDNIESKITRASAFIGGILFIGGFVFWLIDHKVLVINL